VLVGSLEMVARHTSHVTRHTSHVTRRTSHVTRHTSHVTRHISCTLPFAFSKMRASPPLLLLPLCRATCDVRRATCDHYELQLTLPLALPLQLARHPHASRVTPAPPNALHNTSRVTRHASHVTRHASHAAPQSVAEYVAQRHAFNAAQAALKRKIVRGMRL